MNRIRQLYLKCRTWGISGVFAWMRRRIHQARLYRSFKRNCARYPITAPERGFTVIGDLSAQISNSKTLRDFVRALKAAGIPCQTFDLGASRPDDDFRLLRYSHIVHVWNLRLPPAAEARRAPIVFWEFESGLLDAHPYLASCDRIIAMSDFNLTYFRHCFRPDVTVTKILYPFYFDGIDLMARSEIRRRYGIGADAFMVFFNFDYGSSFYRKNPDGAMRAFARAFAGQKDVKLVFKTMRANDYAEEHQSLRDLAAELGIADVFLSIDTYIPHKELYSLTAASDVYLSLHRGEGFGLGVAEAMSLGCPAVVTDYSATTEFCTKETALLVPFRMVDYAPVFKDHPYYAGVRHCAEPDVDAAASHLRRLYEDPVFRAELGRRAEAFIRAHFSPLNFKRSIEAGLEQRGSVSR